MAVRDTNGSSQETKHSLYMMQKHYNHKDVETSTKNYNILNIVSLMIIKPQTQSK